MSFQQLPYEDEVRSLEHHNSNDDDDQVKYYPNRRVSWHMSTVELY